MIGIFDSGFGGLTVMKEYFKKYPEFDYIYLGDQANAPYGPHSKERVEALTGLESRCTVLGHLQRGGSPTTFDRLLGLRFGAAAVRAIADGRFGEMIASDPPQIATVPLAEALSEPKRVPLNSDTVQTARELGVCLGD